MVTLLSFARAGLIICELLPAKTKNTAANFPKKLSEFQWFALPGIVAGWTEAASDCYGNVGYSVTPEGAAAAKQPAPRPPTGLPKPDAALCAVFDDEFDRERDRLLATAPPDPNDIFPLPLSAGGWDEHIGPWNWPHRQRKKSKGAK